MKTTLYATVAFLALAGAAAAQGVVSEVNGITAGLNGQLNLGDVSASLDLAIEEAGSAAATAAGIGNSLSVTVDTDRFGAIAQEVLQGNGGDVTATLNGTIEEIDGTVSATSAAIGNSASLSVDSANGAVVAALGQANTGDIVAKADVAVREAERAVSATAAAIGNSISIVNGIAE